MTKLERWRQRIGGSPWFIPILIAAGVAAGAATAQQSTSTVPCNEEAAYAANFTTVALAHNELATDFADEAWEDWFDATAVLIDCHGSR